MRIKLEMADCRKKIDKELQEIAGDMAIIRMFCDDEEAVKGIKESAERIEELQKHLSKLEKMSQQIKEGR